MTHMRRLTISVVAGLLLVAVAFPGAINAGAPDQSGIVVRFVQIGTTVGYEDPADQLVALTGPPAELGCNGLGFDEYFADVQAAETPPGAIALIAKVDAIPLYVYRTSGFAELCGDVAANRPLTLLGVGTARFIHTDNDFFLSETRMNAFGDVATGTIADSNGKLWNVSAVWRALIEPSEGDDCACRVVQEDITLRPRGG